jgi:hypothetical protein
LAISGDTGAIPFYIAPARPWQPFRLPAAARAAREPAPGHAALGLLLLYPPDPALDAAAYVAERGASVVRGKAPDLRSLVWIALSLALGPAALSLWWRLGFGISTARRA